MFESFLALFGVIRLMRVKKKISQAKAEERAAADRASIAIHMTQIGRGGWVDGRLGGGACGWGDGRLDG